MDSTTPADLFASPLQLDASASPAQLTRRATVMVDLVCTRRSPWLARSRRRLCHVTLAQLTQLTLHSPAAAQAVGEATLPVLAFPEAGLDDSAAYQGYQTRLFRDAARNTVQLYLDARLGRVVHLWADAENESARGQEPRRR